MTETINPCTLYECGGNSCFLKHLIESQSRSGGAKRSDGTGSGGSYWDPKVWQDFVNRTQEMAQNGCAHADMVDNAIASAKPDFIR